SVSPPEPVDAVAEGEVDAVAGAEVAAALAACSTTTVAGCPPTVTDASVAPACESDCTVSAARPSASAALVYVEIDTSTEPVLCLPNESSPTPKMQATRPVRPMLGSAAYAP